MDRVTVALRGLIVALVLLVAPNAAAQYPWPLAPFDEQHRISGTFCEYRGPSNPHFHNGTDIPQPDHSPVYPVADGTVTGITATGSNAYVRVDSFAYVHIKPNPSLSVGSAVQAGETVLGTILPGQGHVHFIDGYPGSYRNALREGALAPFDDPWTPVLSDIRFYSQPTAQRLSANELTGPVRITMRVEERTAPPGTSSAGLNNGAYVVGYRILTRDRVDVVYEPGPDGEVFRFDTKPSESYVHHVFDRLQASTSRHVYVPTNRLTAEAAWETAELPEGDYTVELFAEDTRGNRGTAYIDVSVVQRDIIPPPPVALERAFVHEGRASFTWRGGEADDLYGYRISSSPDALQWIVYVDESALPGTERAYTHVDALAEPTFFAVAAADTMQPPNIGRRSDVYGSAPDAAGLRRILIVDGFDRAGGSGSWVDETHYFAATHGLAIADAAAELGFETIANEALVHGDVDLADYEAVFWVLGDESTAHETFTSQEQALVRTYLDGGGKLFVSGSEIAWDLGNKGSSADRAFLENYLKVRYLGDDASSGTVKGRSGTLFDGVQFSYGSFPYEEDYPDYFTPVNGGEPVLVYGNNRVAGVRYEGPFGGEASGAVVVFGFPFETIAGATNRAAVMERILGQFFPPITGIVADGEELPEAFGVQAAFPNPFRDATTLTVSMPAPGAARMEIYDVLGRRVAVLTDVALLAGRHTFTWAPDGVSAGTYFARFHAGDRVQTVKLVRLR